MNGDKSPNNCRVPFELYQISVKLPMVISFDYDDVLASFQLGWIEFNKIHYNEHYTFEDFSVFDYRKVMGIENDEVFRRIFEFYDSGMLKNLKPIEGAREVVAKLAQEHTLYVLTSRSPEIADISQHWLDEYFPHRFQKILFTGQISRDGMNHTISKADFCREYQIAYHIDDAPFHAEGIVEAGTKVVVLEKPWNRTYDFGALPVIRIKTLAELPEILGK